MTDNELSERIGNWVNRAICVKDLFGGGLLIHHRYVISSIELH